MSKVPGRSDRRGSMPFALVAVTILLIAGAHCAVTASISENERKQDNAEKELNLLGESAESTETFVERGLSQILYEICTSADDGDIAERSARFRERADTWINHQFPIDQSGVTVRLKEYTMEVYSERFQLGTDGTGTDGYTPSYLKAAGTLTATYSSDSGKTTKTIEFSTDGSCALPLTVEMGSLFENAMSDSGTALYQMVKYQLTSLAQIRVINGYGAMYQYGEKGTNSILTEKDVKEAYANAVNALKCIYFRDDSGNSYDGTVDLATSLVKENGRITIDLNAVYAQALAASADNIVMKWFDYFLGNSVLRVCDQVSDGLKNAWSSLKSFVTGSNDFSAEPYIREAVGNLDTNLRSGERFTFTVCDPWSSATREYSVAYPEVDFYGSGLVRNFKSDYNSDTNQIRDWLYKVVNAAILEIANGKGMSTVSVYVSDSTSFEAAVLRGINVSLAGDRCSFEDAAVAAIVDGKIPDQFYAAICDMISRNKDRLFCCSAQSFNDNIRNQLTQIIIDDLSTSNHTVTEEEAEQILDGSFELECNRQVLRDYQTEVDSLVEKFDSLNRITSSHRSVMELGCIAILKGGFLKVDEMVDIAKVTNAMEREYLSYISIDPYSDLIELPEDDKFSLICDSVEYTEKITVTCSSNPVVTVGTASSRSTHETGFKESSYASYCTVFPITIKDEFILEVRSAGNLLYALGMYDSAYRCTIPVDMEIDVSVVSGWGLIGVEYGPSATILSDLILLLMKALEPLLEPLRKIMELAEGIMEKISEALKMLAHYMTEYLEAIYNLIIKPLQEINELFETNITTVFCEQLIDITEDASAIIDISVVGQTLGFTYMGYTVKFTFNLATLEKYTKNIVKAEFEGEIAGSEVTAFINVKTKGETKKTVYVNGGFTIKGDDWDIDGTVDPKMAYGKHYVTIGGTVCGVRIDASLPDAVQYNQIGIALSDVPGLKETLSNIPSPIPGTKMEIDAGMELKYSIPLETGVLINEFESNPEGTDANREWAEILNLSGSAVDLNNWTITTSKNKVHIIKDVELKPGERTVITFTGTFLLNSKEYLILKDPDGIEVDRSSTMSDGYNDSRTCQRGMDGSTEWGMIEGTMGEMNKGGILGENGIAARVVKDIVEKAALKAMTEMKHVYTAEDLQELLTRIVLYAVDDAIGRIADCLVEGSIYLTLDFTDVSSSAHFGYRMYIMADSELVGDILKYLLGKAEALFMNIDDPYNIDIDSVLYDDVYFGMSTDISVKAPSILCASKNYSEKVTLASDIACNLTALAGLFDYDLGTPKVRSQIGIKNCPYELIPKSAGVKKNMTYDYWFLRMTFKW